MGKGEEEEEEEEEEEGSIFKMKPTANALVPISVLTLGTKSKSEQ